MHYWNPYLETLAQERLFELELQNVRKLLQHAKKHSPFYCQGYKDIVPEDRDERGSKAFAPLE